MSQIFNKRRRELIQFISGQASLLALSPMLSSPLWISACTHKNLDNSITGLKPTRKDDLVLAPGLHSHFIAKMGEPINPQGDVFGCYNDFTCFLPFGNRHSEGLLWVNHESLSPEMLHGKDSHQLKRNREEIIQEQKMVGGSILHIRQNQQGHWGRVIDSKYNRRLDATTPIPFQGGVHIIGAKSARGTLANCAGGLTPWGTFLTSEENYDNFYGEACITQGQRKVNFKPMNFGWHKHFPQPPEHYGWVVEVNPFTGAAKKLITLGRAPHEGARVARTRDQKRAVVYMGEDRPGGYLFKFVSTGLHLHEGTLYAADIENGRWLPLRYKDHKGLKKVFKDQLQVLTYAHQAAEIVGATPLDRPEDIEVHPQSQDIFIALTANPDKGNPYGSLLKISKQKDHDDLSFQAKNWIIGGQESGLACPDNLCFDKQGRLWVTCDVSESQMNTPTYRPFKNNGLFVIPTVGSKAGQAIQVASAPRDAELTGPWFSPDQRTLFLSVQHPGALTRKNISQPTSTWPDGPGQMPRSAVVALQGPLLDQLSDI